MNNKGQEGLSTRFHIHFCVVILLLTSVPALVPDDAHVVFIKWQCVFNKVTEGKLDFCLFLSVCFSVRLFEKNEMWFGGGR